MTDTFRFHPRRRLLAATLLLAAAPLGAQAQAAEPLRIGFMPGPYRDAFRIGIEPQLRQLGYEVQYVEFSQGVQPNDAVERKPASVAAKP